jgi:hypothetical protein
MISTELGLDAADPGLEAELGRDRERSRTLPVALGLERSVGLSFKGFLERDVRAFIGSSLGLARIECLAGGGVGVVLLPDSPSLKLDMGV